MERAALGLRLLCVVGCVLSGLVVRGALAQERETVATFVVADAVDGPAQVDDVVGQLRNQLSKDGKNEVHPDIEWPAANPDPGLNGARTVGRAAFSELAEGKAPEEVLRDYGAPIAGALNLVSSVQDAEGRSLLWNLCALRVHLLLLTGGKAGEGATRDAVLDCSRRFIDRPNLGKAWLQEVVRTFQRFTTGVRQVPVSVKTAPAGCELRVYGATVGVTPTIVDLMPGEYEFQVDCAGRGGALHRVQVRDARDLVIRLEADEAFSSRSGTSWLRYRSGAASSQVLDDVAALALEAGANSFVVVRVSRGSDLEVQWMRPPGTLLGAGRVPTAAPPEGRAQQIAAVFQPTAPLKDSPPPTHAKRRRAWGDYALGGGLVAAGAALSVYPFLALARDGQCVDADCNSVYDGKSWKSPATFAAAGALVAAGVAVIWIGPFGKRYSVRVANGLAFKGSF